MAYGCSQIGLCPFLRSILTLCACCVTEQVLALRLVVSPTHLSRQAASFHTEAATPVKLERAHNTQLYLVLSNLSQAHAPLIAASADADAARRRLLFAHAHIRARTSHGDAVVLSAHQQPPGPLLPPLAKKPCLHFAAPPGRPGMPQQSTCPRYPSPAAPPSAHMQTLVSLPTLEATLRFKHLISLVWLQEM